MRRAVGVFTLCVIARGILFGDVDLNHDGCIAVEEFEQVVPAAMTRVLSVACSIASIEEFKQGVPSAMARELSAACSMAGLGDPSQGKLPQQQAEATLLAGRQVQTTRDAVPSHVAPSIHKVCRDSFDSLAAAAWARGRTVTEEPCAPHEDGEDQEMRRLASDVHEGVPMNVSAVNSTIEAEWERDYQILKPVLEARGYDTTSARTLCELPAVFCDYGFRRRAPLYAQRLMGDWVGREYQLILGIVNASLPAVVDPTLFNLKRVGYLELYVSSGAMPPGIEKLQRLSLLWLAGPGDGSGLEGPLPAGFWSLRTRIFLMNNMGRKFAGRLEPDMPMCNYLDFRLYLYLMPTFGGSVEHLGACNKITDLVWLYGVPQVVGNAWAAILAWGHAVPTIIFTLNTVAGPLPFADGNSTVGHVDPWRSWCENGPSTIALTMTQPISGSLPAGLQACSTKWVKFAVGGAGFAGDFPLSFANSSKMDPQGIELQGNAFTGQIPDIPPQTLAVKLFGNRWSGDLPASWYAARGLITLDLSACGMEGPIVNITPYIKNVVLSTNRFSGWVPESWRAASLETIDLSNNAIVGPPFAWGWPTTDLKLSWNFPDPLKAYVQVPPWPLKSLKLSNNPLALNLGFFLTLGIFYKMEELIASNCSLDGGAVSNNFEPVVPNAGGGGIPFAGQLYTKLQTLVLSGNRIESFGFGRASSLNQCWGSDIKTWLPRLKSLLLNDCAALQVLHPWAFTVETLDIRGTLVQAVVQSRVESCDVVFASAAPNCSNYMQELCLFAIPVYTQIGYGKECAQFGAVMQIGRRPSILADSERFAPEDLCRCLPGLEESASGRCAPCPLDFFRSVDMVACTSCPEAAQRRGKNGTSVLDCECAAGYFMSSGVCEMCPENTYSAVTGATSISSCSKCPPGTVADAGTSSLANCICPAGSTLVAGTDHVCESCLAGSHKNASGNFACVACSISHNGVQMTTTSFGSTSSDSCFCPLGTYAPIFSEKVCAACPEGMRCDASNTSEAGIPLHADDDARLPFPGAAPGYMTKSSAPMLPYKCESQVVCPGGRPGRCAQGRDPSSVACGACPSGTFADSEGTCRPCNLSRTVIFGVLAVLAGMFLLVAVARYGVDSRENRKSTLSLMILAAQLVTAVQVLGVLHGLQVEWTEPVRSILKFASLFAFNVDILQLQCVVGTSLVGAFAVRQVFAPGLAITLVVLILARSQLCRKIDKSALCVTIVNALGMLYQTFFVSILMSITLPFVCYSHPGRAGASMVSSPAILCYSSAEHRALCTVAAASCLTNMAPFVAFVYYGVAYYRKKVISASVASRRHLEMFRFLFARIKPQYFWYSSAPLARNSLVCFIPIAGGDFAAFSILALGSTFLLFGALQLSLKPWRTSIANAVDAFISGAFVMLLFCVGMSNSFETSKLAIGLLCAVIVVSILLISLAAGCYALHKWLTPSPFYARFICHQKNGAAAQARYLQLVLVHRTHETCFLDSDHLLHLDDLLDVVRSRTGCLVVYLTSATLRRPWCAGEVATAFSTHKRAITVRTQQFVKPADSDIQPDTIDLYLHTAGVKLAEYGVTNALLADSFVWLLSDRVPHISVDSGASGVARFDCLVDGILACRVSQSPSRCLRMIAPGGAPQLALHNTVAVGAASSSVMRALSPQPGDLGMLTISSQSGDDENIAAAGILGLLMLKQVDHGVRIVTYWPACDEDLVLASFRQALAVVVVLSRDSLTCVYQQKVIQTIHDRHPGKGIIPVLMPDFVFPNDGFYNDLEQTSDGAHLAQAFRSFFKIIGVHLASSASLQVIEAQARDILQRASPTAQATRTSSMKGTWSSCAKSMVSKLALSLKKKEAAKDSDQPLQVGEAADNQDVFHSDHSI